MPNYTLYYFNGRGRAEILRMMFAAAGVKYTDKRFEFNEWDKYRKDMPSMCVPVLEVDGGMRMPETMAIARYLAREYGFYPKNNMEMMRCDYIADCFYEIMHDYMRYFHWKNGRFRFNVGGSGAKVMNPSGIPVAAGGTVGGGGAVGGGGTVGGGGSVGGGGTVGGGRTVGGGGAVGGIGAVGGGGAVGRTGSVGGGGAVGRGAGVVGATGAVGGGAVGGGGTVGEGKAVGGGGSVAGGGTAGEGGAVGGGRAVGGGGTVAGGATGGSKMAQKYDTYMQWRYMNTCHRVLPFLERTLDMHHGGKLFFMGEHVMWCDMMCYCCLESPFMENQAMFSKFPKIMALRTRVAAHPKIAAYLKARCKSTW